MRYTGRVDHSDAAAPVLYWAGNEVAITGEPAAIHTLPPRPSRRIDFYGDSITSGFGILDRGDLENMANADNYLAYGAVISRMLSAEYTCISRSGIDVSAADGGGLCESLPKVTLK